MPSIHKLHVHSVWDGLWEHSAQVKISISIELEPGSSHLRLLDLAGHSENTASVCSISKAPMSPLLIKKRHRSEHEKHEQTLTAHNDQDILDSNSEMDPDFVAPSAKRRLFPIIRSTEVADHASSIKDDESFAPVSPLLNSSSEGVSPLLNSLNEGARCTSNTTVHVHANTDHACQDQTNRSSEPATSYAASRGLVKAEQNAKENTRKKPWQSPSQEDFLPAGKSSSKYGSILPAVRGTTPATTISEDDQGQIASSCDDNPSLKLVGVKRRERPSVSTRSSIPRPKVKSRVSESPSPDVSPRIWLRRYGRFGSSSQWFRSRETTPVHTAPSWKIQDNKLEIFDITSRQSYAIEYEASIRLTGLDDDGWLDFILPGLPRPEDPALSGSLDFQINRSARRPSIDEAVGEDKYLFDKADMFEAQFDTRSLHNVQIGPTQICGRFWPQDSKVLRVRLKAPIYYVMSWNASVSLYTTPTWSKSQGVQLKHQARLQMKQPKQDVFAERVCFSIHIKNGRLRSREYMLKAGRCSIRIEEDLAQQNEAAKNQSALVTVYRGAEDVDLPLDIYFTSTYIPGDQSTLALPTLSPTAGKVLSESILLARPSSPLVMEHVERALFSSWKKTDVNEGPCRFMRFDRVDLPHLFPEGLKDDVNIQIRELFPVRFSALEISKASSIPVETFSPIWNLDIQLDRVCGQNLVCRMDIVVEVGNDSERLLLFDAHNWVPEISFIDGRLATQKAGEWREAEDGQLTLLKTPAMIFGQVVRVEMRWKELITADEFRINGLTKSNVLPTIIGKSVLGGSMTCNDNNVVLSVDDGDADIMAFQFSKSEARAQTRLPKLSQGYSMQLSFHQMLPPSPRIVRFADDSECCSETSSGEPSSLSHNDTRTSRDDACYVTERYTPVITTSTVERHEALPLWRLPLRLASAGLRCLLIPFLFFSVAQLVVAHVGHRLTPSSLENLLTAVIGSNAAPGSRADRDLGYPLPHPSDVEPYLGNRTPSGAAMVNPAGSEAATGDLHEQGPGGKTQVGVSTVAARTSEQAGGLIDWIDRALGWKEVRL